jgi:hypothetical protein
LILLLQIAELHPLLESDSKVMGGLSAQRLAEVVGKYNAIVGAQQAPVNTLLASFYNVIADLFALVDPKTFGPEALQRVEASRKRARTAYEQEEKNTAEAVTKERNSARDHARRGCQCKGSRCGPLCGCVGEGRARDFPVVPCSAKCFCGGACEASQHIFTGEPWTQADVLKYVENGFSLL